MKKTPLLVAILAITVISAFGLTQAFAHQRTDIPTNHEDNQIRITVGHTNEPAYGASSTADGMHGFEMSVVDKDTKLPVPSTGTSLTLTKYYFETVDAFNSAAELEDADQISEPVDFRPLFGSPGIYLHRQIVDTGVYGYHVEGIISYFGVEDIEVDFTAFCDAPGMTPGKFEEGNWAGSFGCPNDIESIHFPEST